MTDPFPQPLKPDPAVALKPLPLAPAVKEGPMHKVQFVIEFVGPRSMPAAAVATLLSPEWYQALGQPQLFAMRPSDLHWHRLLPATDGSYDSLAMAWDLITSEGEITSASALQLMQFAERFGPHISRRAMPLPHPAEVNAVVGRLKQAVEQLDIGFELTVIAPPGGLTEEALWVQCARLGLEFSPSGTFDWRAPNIPYPLLSVSPIGHTDAFSLGNVQRGMKHAGATVGFSVPLCAAPVQALDACFHVAETIASALNCDVQDPDHRRLTDRSKNELRSNLKAALGMFSQLGITTGSPEAQKLFAA